LPPHVRLEPITNSKMFDDRHFYDDLGQILTAFETGTVNPQSVPGTPGSGDNPASILTPLQLFEQQNGPLFNSGGGPIGSGGLPFVPAPPGDNIPPIPVQPGGNPNPNPPSGPTTNGPTPPPPTPPSTHFIWNSTGPESWSQALANWNQGSAPGSPIDTVEIKSGIADYDVSTPTTIAFLTVDPGATLNIKAGTLTVGGLDDEGTINVNSDPLFVVDGPATIGGGHTLTIDGKGNETDFNGSLVNKGIVTASHGGKVLVEGSGTNDGKIEGTRGGEIIVQGDKGVIFDNDGLITAKHHGAVTFDAVAVTNEAISSYASLKPAAITATGRGSIVTFSDGATLTNYGLVLAADHGRIAFDGILVNNQPNDLAESTDDTTGIPGKIEADGRGSVVSFSNGAELDNLGLVEARDHGKVSFDGGTLKNQDRGEIEAAQHGIVKIKSANVTNDGEILAEDRGTVQIDKTDLYNDAGGLIEAAHDGTVSFDRSHIDNKRSATIDADGCGAEITFDHSHIDNSGRIEAEQHGTVSFDRAHVDNKHGGTIAADGWGSLVAFDHSHLQNLGRVEAEHGGGVQFDCSSVDNERGGAIKAKGDGSSVQFVGDKVDNWGLLATTHGGAVLLDFSLISNARGATIDADGCGSQITYDHDRLTNSGLVEAGQHGAVVFDGSFIANARHGVIEADDAAHRSRSIIPSCRISAASRPANTASCGSTARASTTNAAE
jgi:hypothetical protein